MCFTWETLVLVALLRPDQAVDLRLLGKCGGGEALIFTLTFFWPLLVVALQLVHAHQSAALPGSFTGQFPGDGFTPDAKTIKVSLDICGGGRNDRR